MKPLRLIALVVLAALVGLGSSIGSFGEGTFAQRCTVTLSPGSSIQEAIDRAAPGDVICLQGGEWQENLIIEKGLTLRATEVKPEPNVVIRSAKEDWPVILIRSEKPIEVVLQGLKVTKAFGGGCSQYEPEWICAAGISVHGQAHVVIENTTISDNEYGIRMEGSAQATIEYNSINGNKYDGIVMSGSSQATIEHTTISDNRYGIEMWDSSQATIKDTIISGNRAGIGMVDSSQATIQGNTISGNGDGIVMVDSSQVTIRGNKIVNNGEYGVACYQRPCFDTDWRFEGAVRGSGNEISGNKEADVCPEELKFLMTPSGGCYGPKC